MHSNFIFIYLITNDMLSCANDFKGKLWGFLLFFVCLFVCLFDQEISVNYKLVRITVY